MSSSLLRLRLRLLAGRRSPTSDTRLFSSVIARPLPLAQSPRHHGFSSPSPSPSYPSAFLPSFSARSWSASAPVNNNNKKKNSEEDGVSPKKRDSGYSEHETPPLLLSSYWNISTKPVLREDGTVWPWRSFMVCMYVCMYVCICMHLTCL